MLGIAVLSLVIMGLIVLPIILGAQRARWRREQEARVDRLGRTVAELREQVGLLSRRMALMESGAAPAAEREPAPVAAAETPPELEPVPEAPPGEPLPPPEEPETVAYETVEAQVPEAAKEREPMAAPETAPEPAPERPELPPVPTRGVAGFQRKLARFEQTLMRKLMGVPGQPAAADASGEPEAAGAARETVASAPPESPAVRAPARLEQIQQKFMENWTGILGALVVVAGVTFVGIYTALRLEPFYRFLMTLGAGAVFVGASAVLARREQWRAFATWIRSAGAAIVLFACAAAGGLPGLGLQWIEVPQLALALLLAGIAANLYLAWAGKAEVFASLHVLLSLVPMAIVPPSAVGLAIASAVALFGVGLAVYGRWDRHLLAVLVAYIAFQVLWFIRMGGALDPFPVKLFAAACAAVVFGAGLAAHHRKGYATRDGAALQIGAHVGSAAMLALTAFVYLHETGMRSAVLLALAAATWVLARRARDLGVPWLYRADVLAGQGFVLLALAGLFDIGASPLFVAVAALAELVAFRRLVPRDQDAKLDRIADALPVVAAGAALLSALDAFVGGELGLMEACALVFLAAAICLVGQRVMRAPPESDESAPWVLDSTVGALAWFAGGLVLVALHGVMEKPWMEAAALAAVGVLLAARHRLRYTGLTAGTAIGLGGAHLLSWTGLVFGRDWAAAALSPRMLPLAVLAAAAVWLGGNALQPLAIVLLGIDAGLAAYLYLDPISALIPGVAWLMLSLVALEIANRLEGRQSSTVLMVGYGYLAAFAVAYATVIVQTPAYVAGLKARLLIEGFALAVLAYWWFFRPRPALGEHAAWLRVHPYFLEVLLVGAAVTVVVEIHSVWWAVAWAAIALALLSRPAEGLLDARARFYSLVFYWVSIADMATILSVLEVPSTAWHDRPEIVSLMAIALQVAYVVQAHRRLELAGLETPAGTGLVRRLGAAVARRRNFYVYYPLFAGIAVFLFWRFDRSLLTLLWSAEAFVVFILSAWLRENQFRVVALAGLGVCLFRLVFVDMAEANLGIRGVVFIGVGLLMLGMNAIYNRFRARFEA